MGDTKTIEHTLNAATIAIGVYMLVSYAGAALPPALSGVAFVLIGISLLLSSRGE